MRQGNVYYIYLFIYYFTRMDKFNNHSNESRDVVELSGIEQEAETLKQKIKSDLDQLRKGVRFSRSKKQENLSNKKEWIEQEAEALKQKIKSDLDQLRKDVRSSRSKKQENLLNKKEWIVQETELVTKESKSEGSALKNTISSQSRKKKKSKTI